jgi:predicted metal-dependent HD superfamily phosphohydrolase/predicted Fe-S protein YdhL (DUF1289 family)
MQSSTTEPESWLKGLAPSAYAGCDPALWPQVRAAYESPGRHYHGWSHVLACLAQFKALHFDRPRVVLLALLFHDAVYVPGRTDNEARSAELAERLLLEHAQIPEAEREQIAQLILATAQHHAPHTLDEDGRRFMDIDLSVLGQPWPVYVRYAQQVRDEWCPAVVSEGAYVQGRQRFLQTLLAQPHIYASEAMARDLEAQARANLQRESQSLIPSAPSPCVRICTLNEQDECLGCGRTLADICGWTAMSEPDKQRCVARAQDTLRRLGRPLTPGTAAS